MTKSKTRITPSTIISTDAEFRRRIDAVARLQTEIRKSEVIRDTAIQEIQETHKKLLEPLNARLEGSIATLELYAISHRDSLFPTVKKSDETELASFGFRQSPAKITTLNKRWTFAKAIEAVKQLFPGRFVRAKEELDKEKIKDLTDEQVASVGLRREQSDIFWIEPKLSDAERMSL
jgi:phage host-nuclease inhibitor protein Gam